MGAEQPYVKFRDGNAIPQLGFGVWQIDDDTTSDIVGQALKAGYRHIDTAQAYGNEAGVGRAINESGLAREDIFVTSKLRTGDYGYDSALKSFDGTMERLNLEVIDLFLLHWPVPAHDGLASESWKALIEIHKSGRAKSIGVSNFLPDHLERIIGETGVIPVVNQLELHPHYQQRHVRDVMRSHDIAIQCYSPLGRGVVLEEPEIVAIADAHGKSTAQVIIRWHLQQGLIALPKTASPERVGENFDVFDFELTADQMAAIDGLDRPDGKVLPEPTEWNRLF